MDRIFFDSNSGDEVSGYVLAFELSKQDIRKMRSRVRDGAIVLLYMPDELEVEARLKFDHDMKCWRGIPIGPFKIL